jgi:hypothetical protein
MIPLLLNRIEIYLNYVDLNKLLNYDYEHSFTYEDFDIKFDIDYISTNFNENIARELFKLIENETKLLRLFLS